MSELVSGRSASEKPLSLTSANPKLPGVRRTRLMGEWRGEQRFQGPGRRKAFSFVNEGPQLEELYRFLVDFTLRALRVLSFTKEVTKNGLGRSSVVCRA